MSEDPNQPRPLDYRRPEPKISIGMQALIGALVTCIVLCGLCVAAGFLALLAGSATMGLWILSLLAAISFGFAHRYAQRRKLIYDERGWAIGIYLGMGLAGLFWGLCGVVVGSFLQTYRSA